MRTSKPHHVTFERNIISGEHRAKCTCGWAWWGSLADCQLHASVHDHEWVPVEVPESVDA